MESASSNRRCEIAIFDHTGSGAVRVGRIREQARRALPFCLEVPGSEEPVLPALAEVEVSLIDDETIARVHADFLDDATPTDVITFHHGEILISLDTARREAPLHGNTIEEETLLYLIHGLLHLNGHTDLREPDRERMHRRQEQILRSVLADG